jgi:hypothetical protein
MCASFRRGTARRPDPLLRTSPGRPHTCVPAQLDRARALSGPLPSGSPRAPLLHRRPCACRRSSPGKASTRIAALSSPHQRPCRRSSWKSPLVKIRFAHSRFICGSETASPKADQMSTGKKRASSWSPRRRQVPPRMTLARRTTPSRTNPPRNRLPRGATCVDHPATGSSDGAGTADATHSLILTGGNHEHT